MLNRSLIEGDVKKSLLRFALPFLAATLLQFTYGAADLIIVGQFDPTGAGVAAVTTGSQLMQTATSLLMGLATGGTVLIGQYWGAQRREDVSRTIGTMFTFFAILAVVMTAVVTLGTNFLVSLMKVPDAAVEGARQYIFICGCGVIFITGYNMVSGILRGLGDSKHPMMFVAIACVTNIIGDLVLVGPLGMGPAGAAIATVAAQALSLLLSVFVLRARDFPFDFKASSFRIAGDKLRGLVRVGTPVAVQNILVSISFLIITAVVNNMHLVAASAAMGTASRIIDFCMMGPVAFYSAISAMTAQNIGAGREDRAKKTLRYGVLFSLLFGAVMFALILLFPREAIRIVNRNPEVVELGVLCLYGFSFDCILVAFIFSFNGFFGGCGRTGFTMVNNLSATFLVRIPFTLIVASMPDPSLYLIGLASPPGVHPAGHHPAHLLQAGPLEGRLHDQGGRAMTAEVLAFLGGDPGRIALFEAAEAAILACGESEMSVQKSQISWGNPLKFVFLSLPLRLGRGRPGGGLLLTFGLEKQVRHPKIVQAVEPYPNRWTHHVILESAEDVDGTVAGWIQNSYDFSRAKKRRKRLPSV